MEEWDGPVTEAELAAVEAEWCAIEAFLGERAGVVPERRDRRWRPRATWYLRLMAKTQINIRMDDETAEMARQAAETRRIPVNEYVEQLIRNDNERLRAVFMGAAQEVLDEFGELIDEPEAESGS